MADIKLTYKDAISVIKDIKDFINNTYSGVSGSPIADPYTDSGRTRGAGIGLAVYEDETITPNLPKLTIYTVDLPSTRMAGGKSQYREQHRYEFALMYTCGKKHTWTYSGSEYTGKQQCIKYLQYLGDKIKAYSGSFEAFNEITIGTISNPIPSDDTTTYSCFIPIQLDSYGRVGQ